MAVFSKIKVTAVNMPKGTMTIMFDNDPTMEWNYNIPFDELGNPIQGDELLRYIVAQSYQNISLLKQARAEMALRESTNYDAFESMRRQEYDLSELVREYEQLIGPTDQVA